MENSDKLTVVLSTDKEPMYAQWVYMGKLHMIRYDDFQALLDWMELPNRGIDSVTNEVGTTARGDTNDTKN